MQGVLVFASAAARDAAITSPQEGQCCYLKDTDAVLTYSGSAWVGFDDSNAVQNSIVDAKGDLIAASGADTPARLAVGNNGETLVADSSTSTGLRWQGDYAAGKNKIINGAFDNWQRGTSFTITNESYTSDRFKTQTDKTGTVSRQTFTPGTAPVAGYEGQYYLRSALNAVGSYYLLNQPIENVQTFAGQTVTLSFWARVSSGTVSNAPEMTQNFGSGGSGAVTTSLSGQTFTTDWQRFSVSVAVPSVSGKTIGTSSALEFKIIRFVSASAATIDIWGVQVEAGSVATAFQTATGTIQGELAACQRYYFRTTGGEVFANGLFASTTKARVSLNCPVTMRINNGTLEANNLWLYDGSSTYNMTAIGYYYYGTQVKLLEIDVASGGTASRPVYLSANAGSATSYIGVTAEL
jgi:hypothetical protein